MKCLYCGKPLKLWKYRADGPSPFSLETLQRTVTVDGKLPEFGYIGSNGFCTQQCGCWWAIREARKRS